MQDFGEGISIETRAMGLERKASESEKQLPRSGLVQHPRHAPLLSASLWTRMLESDYFVK